MNYRHHYQTLLHHQLDGTPWYGKSITELLINNSPEISKTQESGIISQIIHINNWKKYCVAKLHGDPDYAIEMNSENDWPSEQNTIYSKSIQAALLEYQLLQGQLLKLIDQKCDSDLMIRVVPGCDFNYKYLLDGIIHHDLYHIGQIAYILNHD